MSYTDRRTGVALLVFALLGPFLACSSGAGSEGADLGKPAPSYSAVTQGGDSIALASTRGRVVLLNVWATWCHPCREEIPVLEKLHEVYGDSGLSVIGVSIDARGEERTIKEFVDRMGMTYPIWLDPDDRVSRLFFAIGVPSSYLIGRDGTLLWRHIGPIKPSDPGLTPVLTNALAARQP
jgi:thiol-disulfide isomerase/thioredoxin